MEATSATSLDNIEIIIYFRFILIWLFSYLWITSSILTLLSLNSYLLNILVLPVSPLFSFNNLFEITILLLLYWVPKFLEIRCLALNWLSRYSSFWCSLLFLGSRKWWRIIVPLIGSIWFNFSFKSSLRFFIIKYFYCRTVNAFILIWFFWLWSFVGCQQLRLLNSLLRRLKNLLRLRILDFDQELNLIEWGGVSSFEMWAHILRCSKSHDDIFCIYLERLYWLGFNCTYLRHFILQIQILLRNIWTEYWFILFQSHCLLKTLLSRGIVLYSRNYCWDCFAWTLIMCIIIQTNGGLRLMKFLCWLMLFFLLWEEVSSLMWFGKYFVFSWNHNNMSCLTNIFGC